MPYMPYSPKGPARPNASRLRGGASGAEGVSEPARRRDAAIIARLKGELSAQAEMIREQAVSLAHSRKIFDRASAAARIGVWECSLPDETLHWTDVVYDLFDLPRGALPDRQRTLACYPPECRKALEVMRSRAIEERSGFALDCEITTFAGRNRWIRITATVECEDGVPVRIFGMKQDITEEKILSDRMRYLAEFDVMTGLANRGQFQARLSQAEQAGPGTVGALLLIDLDGFKAVNDTYGHVVGDDCLKEAAARLGAVCQGADLVARVGGDEFALAEVDAAEVTLTRRVTTEQHFVVPGVETCNLEFEIVLVGPEPWKRSDCAVFSADCRRSDLGLLAGARYGFQTNTRAVSSHGVAGAVAGGHDVGVAGAGLVVDHDAVVDG